VKIAYIMNTYPRASTTFIRREILALERQGIKILRVALRTRDDEVVDKDDKAEQERTRYVLHDGPAALGLAVLRTLLEKPKRFARAFVLACTMGRRADRPLFVHLVYLAEACRIEPWLRHEGVQHVHAHFGTNTAEVAMLVHMLGGPSWSFTVHGPEEFDKAPLIRLAEKLRRCAFVVAISSYGRSQLYRRMEYDDWSKVRVAHCGLDQNFFAAPAKPPSWARRLLCVGRLCEQKGQLLLVEAARRLVADGTQFQLVIAGDGELRGEIEALIARYKLQECVRMTGWITGDKVREEIFAARALVLPSFAEGLPVVLTEAMALRRPVISTYIAGIPELVCPGENGWLVPAGDVEALVDAMQVCLDTPADALIRMGEAAHKRVFALHCVDSEAAQLAKFFDATIERTRHFSN
jgi:colanic acid/amylovoran biosynthesis glycosyltransferase